MTQQWSWGVKPVNEDGNDPENLAYAKIRESCLEQAEDPPLKAAEIAGQEIRRGLVGIGGKAETRMLVRRVCRGAMRAMMDAGQDLAKTAAALLKALERAASDIKEDSKVLKGWCLEGIADVTLLAGAQARSQITAVIEFNFPGVGAQFTETCLKARAKQWWTK